MDNHDEHDKAAKQTILQNVEKYGLHIALFEADNYLPAFAYSIGLYKNYGHPEIICFGLPKDLMGIIINHAHDLIKESATFVTEKLYSGFLKDFDIQFLQVNQSFYPDYLGYGGWFHNNTWDFPVLQLVWCDKQQYFPWEDNFNPDWKYIQPLLDRDTDFKFYEPKNLGVYTTQDVQDGEPILYVYHNTDGDWQFHSSDNPDIEMAKLVSLQALTNLDPTINNIYFLQYGWKAWRNTIDDEWEYEEDTED